MKKQNLGYSGSYILLLTIRRKITAKVGNFGEWVFPKGYYSYTGSAMRGLEKRVLRHCSKKKKLHWHIDYLLEGKGVEIVKILTFPSKKKDECQLNQQLKKFGKAKVLIPGFGSSDCKSGCGSHLLYWGKRKFSKIAGISWTKVL